MAKLMIKVKNTVVLVAILAPLILFVECGPQAESLLLENDENKNLLPESKRSRESNKAIGIRSVSDQQQIEFVPAPFIPVNENGDIFSRSRRFLNIGISFGLQTRVLRFYRKCILRHLLCLIPVLCVKKPTCNF